MDLLSNDGSEPKPLADLSKVLSVGASGASLTANEEQGLLYVTNGTLLMAVSTTSGLVIQTVALPNTGFLRHIGQIVFVFARFCSHETNHDRTTLSGLHTNEFPSFFHLFLSFLSSLSLSCLSVRPSRSIYLWFFLFFFLSVCQFSLFL